MIRVKPSLPRGVRDFLPAEVLRRRHIFQTIEAVFTLAGYQPIETPALENLSVLAGKYGEEGDRLMFRILNSGDFLKELPGSMEGLPESDTLRPLITEKALRYDLTVPFARYVVMHENELPLPFKRYQIQPVWRADRPQRGRYREFTQCDADVIGSHSLLYEAELIWIYTTALTRLGLNDFSIYLNHRQVLAGIAEVAGQPEKIVDICVAIDKLDKIGRAGVEEELMQRGISTVSIGKLAPVFDLTGTTEEMLTQLEAWLADSEVGMQGIAELKTVLALLERGQNNIKLDISLARGLNYYTGIIMEVRMNNFQMGSIGGGGRYAGLTDLFGGKGLPGVGISFGADRIYDVMQELGLFEASGTHPMLVLITQNETTEPTKLLELANELRAAGVAAEVYPDLTKLEKQLKYANKKGIKQVILLTNKPGETFNLKDMDSGQQTAFATMEALVAEIRAQRK